MYSHVPQKSFVVLTHAPQDQQFLSEVVLAEELECALRKTTRTVSDAWLKTPCVAAIGRKVRAGCKARQHVPIRLLNLSIFALKDILDCTIYFMQNTCKSLDCA